MMKHKDYDSIINAWISTLLFSCQTKCVFLGGAQQASWIRCTPKNWQILPPPWRYSNLFFFSNTNSFSWNLHFVFLCLDQSSACRRRHPTKSCFMWGTILGNVIFPIRPRRMLHVMRPVHKWGCFVAERIWSIWSLCMCVTWAGTTPTQLTGLQTMHELSIFHFYLFVS